MATAAVIQGSLDSELNSKLCSEGIVEDDFNMGICLFWARRVTFA